MLRPARDGVSPTQRAPICGTWITRRHRQSTRVAQTAPFRSAAPPCGPVSQPGESSKMVEYRRRAELKKASPAKCGTKLLCLRRDAGQHLTASRRTSCSYTPLACLELMVGYLSTIPLPLLAQKMGAAAMLPIETTPVDDVIYGPDFFDQYELITALEMVPWFSARRGWRGTRTRRCNRECFGRRSIPKLKTGHAFTTIGPDPSEPGRSHSSDQKSGQRHRFARSLRRGRRRHEGWGAVIACNVL